jgi:hypothetical protein
MSGDNWRTPADVLGPMFSRGDLPARVQVLRDVPRHGLRAGDVFTWSEDARGYVCERLPDVMVLAASVRSRFFDDFNHAGPAPAQHMELIT